MAATITLGHISRTEGEQMFYFYNGEAKATDGKLTLPTDDITVVKRAWLQGYRKHGKKTLNTWPEVEELINS